MGRFWQGGGHLTEWAMVPLQPRALVPLSRSYLAGVDAVAPSDAPGKPSPARPGSGATPLALRVRKRSQGLRDARGSHSSPSLRSTQEWGGYRPPGAHLCSQTRMALTPRHLAPGQGQAGPGSEWAAGSGATLFLRHQGLILPRARSALLAITVGPSTEPHSNSSPGADSSLSCFFFLQKKSMVSPLSPLWKEET